MTQEGASCRQGSNICLICSKPAIKNNHIVAGLPTDLCFLPSVFYAMLQFAVTPGRSELVRVLTVIHGHSELRRCPRELRAKAVGRVAVAWARVQPELNSLYGRCVGPRCEETLFSQFSSEMQILFLLNYFSIEREENNPKQL